MADHPIKPNEDLPAFEAPPGYRSYLLRCWEERGEQPAIVTWRFSLEDPHTTQRYSFADLDALLAWLRTEFTPAQQ